MYHTNINFPTKINSISNQKRILEEYAKQNDYTNLRFYTDDEYSGVNFERPGFQEMLFPQKDILYIAIKSNMDSGQIYSLCLAGNSPTKIACMLSEQQIPTPGTLYFMGTGNENRYYPDSPYKREPTLWYISLNTSNIWAAL